MSTSRPATHTYGSDEATLFEVELRRQGLGHALLAFLGAHHAGGGTGLGSLLSG